MPELRKDPITGRWVIIAVDRAKSPRDFARQRVSISGVRFCPFCPGNELRTPPEVLAYRTHGAANSPGWTLRVVPNKFPALRVEGSVDRRGDGLYDKMSGVGAHEVIVESPEHMQTLADLPSKSIEDLFWSYRDRVLDLSRDERLRYILLFKNHGESAGQSLEHTHSQIIALPIVPKRVQEEVDGASSYFQFKDRCVYCDIVRQELQDRTRVVLESDHFLAICPYAARFPFETWIVPKIHHSHAEASSHAAVEDLGSLLRSTLRKLNGALEHPPYNLILHTAPVRDEPLPHYHWHLELIPKLTYVAGFEWGSGFYINPTPPEESAKFLREAQDA